MLKEYRIRWHKRKIARLEARLKEFKEMTEKCQTSMWVREIVSTSGYIAELKVKLEYLEAEDNADIRIPL